ncbi:MAG: PSD1 and planctomycete cytochrome C domain-containing protein, partial [Bryobacteraceae bacterium]
MRCQPCHGAQQQMNGLRLDNGADAMLGGYSGPAIMPGESARSKLITMVESQGKLVMPPVGPRLTESEVAVLRTWIDQGATWPADPARSPARMARRSNHWSLRPVRKPIPPLVSSATWVRNPIDRFVLARLDREGLAPSPEADKTTLLRRLHLDLTGVPPNPNEIDAFLADSRPDAYERAVDRLLASPHYGEKWARQWLDLARYADSDGYESDRVRPHAWRYRHWVIDALNNDLPFDQFTIQQIAGDLLPQPALDHRIATGFHRNTLTNREGGVDTEEFRIEQVFDRTNTIGTVWLGLTVGCAQCHDHKYDPISQREYYQMFAFLNTAQEEDIEAPIPGERGPYLASNPVFVAKRDAFFKEHKIDELQQEWERQLLHAAANPGRDAEWDTAWKFFGNNSIGGQQIIRLPASARSVKQREQMAGWFLRFGIGRLNLPKERMAELRKKQTEIEASAPQISHAQAIREAYFPPKTQILLRGDFRNKGAEVGPDTPAALHAFPQAAPKNRLGLAQWLVSPENPLTARVTVNRYWQEFFGRGLVRTSEDFGSKGEPASHPELLDWLASEFLRSGWSAKTMHRLIVTSATYRQSSRMRPDLDERDPDNILLARQGRLRLPAELIRDSALSAAGLLNPAIGGRSVRPPQPKGVAELGYANSVKWEQSGGPDRYRRGLYIHFQRTTPYP